MEERLSDPNSDKKTVFVVSHALVEPSNRERWFELAKIKPNWNIYLIIPSIWVSTWFGEKKTIITKPEKNKNLEIIPFYPTHKSKWTLYLSFSLPFLLLKHKPDYIFCFQEEGTVSLCWSLICKKIFHSKSKIGFFSWQNISIHQQKWHQRLRWNLTKYLSDFFLAGTNEIANLFKENHYLKPIFIQTEIGVSKKNFKEDHSLRNIFRSKHHLDKYFTIGFAGRLVKEKGIYDLQQTLDSITTFPFKMIWAGDGIESQNLQALRQDDIFLGQIDADQMCEFYNGIDLLILPSKTTSFWKEQFGLVIAQSLLCQTPVIGSDSGAIPEVIQNHDYIFPEGDIKALKEKIIKFKDGSLSPSHHAESFLTTNLAIETKNLIQSI